MSEKLFKSVPSAVIERTEMGMVGQVRELVRLILWDKVLRDKLVDNPIGKEGLDALKRLGKNFSIVLADSVPVLGSVVHWSADVLKLSKHDATPDVSKLTAWGANIIDVLTLDTIPSYWIQAALQLRKDLPKLQALLKLIQKIRTEEMEDYEENQSQVDGAIRVFGTEERDEK